MSKKVIYSALGGALTLFLLGGLTYEVLLKDVYIEMLNAMGDVANPNPSLGAIAAAQLSLSLLLALLFNLLNVNNFKEGATQGAWITFLVILWYNLWMFTTFKFMTINMSLIDIITTTLMGIIAGGMIGLIQGKVVSKTLTAQH